MELNEERVLKEVIDEFSAAVQVFTQKEYKKAGAAFDGIVEKYKDSDYYSVLEIQARAKAYKNICHAQLNPVKIEPASDEDYLNEGLFNLNAGDFERALELLHHIEGKGFQDAYVNYLLGVAYFKKDEDVSKTLEYLEKSVKEDSYYKIIIHNEPDFTKLHEEETFIRLITPDHE